MDGYAPLARLGNASVFLQRLDEFFIVCCAKSCRPRIYRALILEEGGCENNRVYTSLKRELRALRSAYLGASPGARSAVVTSPALICAVSFNPAWLSAFASIV